MLTKEKSASVIEAIIALYPDAKPSLHFNNHFELLIAVMLSAQTTDAMVNKVTPALFAAYPDAIAMAKESPKVLETYISKLGLYRNKARFMQACAQELVEKYGGTVPSDRQSLESLAGVGRKTANVVMSVGFGIPAFAVDTHVERICKHHQIVSQRATPREVEEKVMAILPAERWLPAHQAMILFGREICHPKNPTCDQYPQLFP